MIHKANQFSNGVNKLLFFIIISIFVFLPHFSEAQEVLGQETVFNIESSYDFSQRSEISASLMKISLSAYWYIDTDFWQNLSIEEQVKTGQSLDILIQEFEESIHPKLTGSFGSEWSPGIDKDTRITILVHSMKKGTGGYTDTSDEYPREQIPQSNEREMIYLNTEHINSSLAKSFLAHEFMHLITFNQKNKINNVSEEVWLNEARSEYAITFLGYDQEYKGSNLERRVKDFIDKPSDSLTEWRDTPSDYGVVNLFSQYLVDHYKIQILADSLRMKKTGIESINAILSQSGFKEDFSQIFINWTIAVLINNCEVSEKYCYFNPNLKNFRITPLVNYLPFVGQSVLSVNNTTKDWAGNWHKFIGGKGTLKLTFNASSNIVFKVPYIIQSKEGNLSINNLALSQNKNGEITIEDFGSENISLVIIPLAQNKTFDFADIEPSRGFFWSASTEQEEEIIVPSLPSTTKPISQMTKSEILLRISQIQAVVLQLQQLLKELNQIAGDEISCQNITQNLYFGMRDSAQVECLQEFLLSQGVYPEGVTNGNFFSLTQQAVIRFQEKYSQEILTSFGLSKGTGFVGASTRTKINELLSQ